MRFHLEMWSWALLALGLLASSISGVAWHAVAQNKENDSAAATANGARAKLSQSLQDDFDVAGTMGTLVTVNPALTNSEASQWFDIDGGNGATSRHLGHRLHRERRPRPA